MLNSCHSLYSMHILPLRNEKLKGNWLWWNTRMCSRYITLPCDMLGNFQRYQAMKPNLQAWLSLATTFALLLGLEEYKSSSFGVALDPNVHFAQGTANSATTAASNSGQPGGKPEWDQCLWLAPLGSRGSALESVSEVCNSPPSLSR